MSAIHWRSSSNDLDRVAAFLPPPLLPASGRCAVYFAEWQFATDEGREYLDPVGSQYNEAIFLISATLEGETVAYCPFIWVDQDIYRFSFAFTVDDLVHVRDLRGAG